MSVWTCDPSSARRSEPPLSPCYHNVQSRSCVHYGGCSSSHRAVYSGWMGALKRVVHVLVRPQKTPLSLSWLQRRSPTAEDRASFGVLGQKGSAG